MSDGQGSGGICPGTSRQDGSCESRAFFGEDHTGGLSSNYAAGGQHPHTKRAWARQQVFPGLPRLRCLFQKPTSLLSPLEVSTQDMKGLRGREREGLTCSLPQPVAPPVTQLPRPESLTSGQPLSLSALPHLLSSLTAIAPVLIPITKEFPLRSQPLIEAPSNSPTIATRYDGLLS